VSVDETEPKTKTSSKKNSPAFMMDIDKNFLDAHDRQENEMTGHLQSIEGEDKV